MLYARGKQVFQRYKQVSCLFFVSAESLNILTAFRWISLNVNSNRNLKKPFSEAHGMCGLKEIFEGAGNFFDKKVSANYACLFGKIKFNPFY